MNTLQTSSSAGFGEILPVTHNLLVGGQRAMTPRKQQRTKGCRHTSAQIRKAKVRNTVIPWLILIGNVLVIFALGTLFGYHLTSYTSAEQANTQPTAENCANESTEAAEFTGATEAPKGVPGLSLEYDLQMAMYESCQKYDVPLALALAVAETESGFNPDAESRTDDYGLMQINRCNFEYLRDEGIDPLTYKGNIEAGVMFLGENLTLYGDEGLAVMAYNCGRAGAKNLWDAGIYSTAYSRTVIELYEKWLGVLEVQQ